MDNLVDVSDKKYLQILEETKQRILSSRIKLAKAASREQFQLYWWLGQKIVESQEKFGWGKSIVEKLSIDLKKTFGGTTGFSPQNLWYMRQFFLAYRDHPNLQQLVGEIPWGQNLLILSKVKTTEAKEYYLKGVIEEGWTRNVLRAQIESHAHIRHHTNKQHTFKQSLPSQLAEQAEHAMKDIYMLDTLGLTEPVLESEIENRMVSKIKNVMLELGYGFSFIGNQYRIAAGDSEFFIDLLFYNRKLQSLVAMEIKRGKFQPEYAGKMNFYLNLLDDFVREPHENPSIGIILCSERNRCVVEYALQGINKPIGVSEFRLSNSLPTELQDKLPDPHELEKEIMKEFGQLDANDIMELEQIG